MKFNLATAALGLCLLAVPVNAATIDFSGFTGGSVGSNTVSTPNATFTTTDGIYLNQGGPSDICAFNTPQFSCQGVDMTIDFTNAVQNLSFVAFYYNPFDFVTVTAFNGASIVGSVDITGDGLVDLAALGTITKLFLKDFSTGAGYAYKDFSFDVAAPVPVPAALPLLATGLGLLGVLGLRRKNA